MADNKEQLSRTVSYVLRHAPNSLGLKMDSKGWVDIYELVFALKCHGWPNIEKNDLIDMVNKAKKKRHEITDNRIRALYGHSLDNKIIKQAARPPVHLYHGTVSSNLSDIMNKGLLPMKRQYVHLSSNEELARKIGARKKGNVIVLKINANQAYLEGTIFYNELNEVWLSEAISSKHIFL
jgi:putative RNA 2'-phosphotransferase